MDYQKLFKSKLDRRRLLGNLGLMGAGAVMTACGGAIGQPTTPTPPTNPMPGTDVDNAILNFALNLEYLEAAFYLAAVGRISEIQAIGGDAAIDLPEGFDGTTSVDFESDDVASYAAEIAQDELNHVKALVATLGDAASARPHLDLSNSFAGAAVAAGILPDGMGAAFNPFASDLFFLHGSFILKMSGSPPITAQLLLLRKALFLERLPASLQLRRITLVKSVRSSIKSAIRLQFPVVTASLSRPFKRLSRRFPTCAVALAV